MKKTSLKPFFILIFNRAIWGIRSLSIYKRLMLSFLIVVIIPNILIGYYSFMVSSREIENRISSSSKQALKSVELTLNEKLKRYEGISNQISSNTEIINSLRLCSDYQNASIKDLKAKEKYEESKKRISSILFQVSNFEGLSNIEIVCGIDEITQIDEHDKKKGASLKDVAAYVKSKNYIKAVAADGFPVWSDTSKEKGVFLYQPGGKSYIGSYITLNQAITDKYTGKLFGVIIINVPVVAFEKMVNFQNLFDENEVVFLVGKEGIVSVLNGIYPINKIPDKEILNEIMTKQDGSIIKKIGDNDYILTFYASEKASMVIAYMADRNKILHSIYSVGKIIIEVSIICILFAILISFLVTTSISIPLNKLKKSMKKVGGNELSIVYKDNQKDEIGVLGENFNEMVYRIKSLIDSLVDAELAKKNEEIRRKEAELDALQMQIKPHFMYNTLDLIRWNSILGESGDGPTSKMIAAFSKLLRFNTMKADKLIDIGGEVEHILAYIKVVKFKEELKIKLDLDFENEDIKKCKITKLTFQPIVENAIRHGHVYYEKEFIILIRAYILDGDIFIEIRDNGIGINPARLEELNDELKNRNAAAKSIGIRNVDERIKLHFGQEYGLHIDSQEGEFTSVTIHIPQIAE